MTATQLKPSRPAQSRPAGGRRPGLPTAYRFELTKLAAQARARYALLGCLLAPVLVVFILDGQGRPPKDTLFGRHVHASGYAVPLLLLSFAAQWVLPLLTSLVAGDIFASEDSHGTWKTILTRSVSRGRLFAAKTLVSATYAVLVLVVLATSTILASTTIVGTQDLIGLSGQLIPGADAARLVVQAWATALPPLLAFTSLAILLSVLSRNPAVGVVAPIVIGFVLQLVGSLGGIDLPRRLLLTTPFEAWHGLLVAPPFSAPLWLGLAVSAAWCAVCLALAYTALRRRDITGG